MKRALVVFLCLFTSITIAIADEMTWTGTGGDNRWNNPTNWDKGKVPGENDNVTIPSGTPTCKIPSVKVNSFINEGKIDDSGSGLKIETVNEFSNRGTISTDNKIDISSGSFLRNSGNITGKPVSIKGNVVENNITGEIKGYGTNSEFDAVDIYASTKVNNRGTITSDQIGDANFPCFFYITTDGDGEVNNYGIIAGDDVVSGQGGNVRIKTGTLVNNGEIRSGNSGSDEMDGNLYIYAWNIDNTGTLTGGQTANEAQKRVSNIHNRDQDIVIGNVTLIADSIAIHLDNRYVDADTLRIVCRRLNIFDITVPRSIWANSCIKIFTTGDGSVDLSGTRTQYAINTEPPDGFTRIYSNTIIAPPEGLQYIFDPPPMTFNADNSIVGGNIYSPDVIGEAGASDSIHITMQNLSTTSKSLDYTVSSLKGWIIPASGSTAAIHPFAFADVDAGYTIPGGTTPGEEDTVVAIVSIAPGFSDTSFSSIYCAGEPATCQIEIISPNGGETWCSGSQHGITWETVNTSGHICIEYSSDGGQTWHMIVDDTPDDGVHPWTLPGLQGDARLVRICDCNNALCCDVSSNVFSICTVPQADFTADPETGSGDTCQIQCTDQSTGCVTGWSWDFGDGETSVDQNPIHNFDCNGPNTASLIVTGPCGADTVEHEITCTCPSPCSLVIIAPACSPAGCETLCTDDLYPLTWTARECQSEQYHLRYSTDHGASWTDMGTTADTTDDWIIPEVSWPNASLLEICCSGEHPPCCDTVAFSIVALPQADFTADPQTGTGLTCHVGFTDHSTGCVTSWSWDFGDGGTSTFRNPNHIFQCNGPYTVSLTVSGPCGEDTETKIGHITCACSTSHTPGDVNCDGTVTPGDALCAFWRAILGSFQEECECDASELAADVNCDGTITPGDALCIFWYAITGVWPEGCRCE